MLRVKRPSRKGRSDEGVVSNRRCGGFSVDRSHPWGASTTQEESPQVDGVWIDPMPAGHPFKTPPPEFEALQTEGPTEAVLLLVL